MSSNVIYGRFDLEAYDRKMEEQAEERMRDLEDWLSDQYTLPTGSVDMTGLEGLQFDTNTISDTEDI